MIASFGTTHHHAIYTSKMCAHHKCNDFATDESGLYLGNREGKWLKTNGRFGWMRTDKVRNHFGVGRVSQAGALAALEDQVQHSHVDRIDLFWGGLTYVSVCAGVFKLSARAHAVRT
jgi:hypothetical protein